MIVPKLDEISDSMCMAKWLWTSIHLTNGTTNSCFLPPIHKIDPKAVTLNPKELHNTPEKKQQRAMMLNGEQPDGCSYCWNIEKMGRVSSDRHYSAVSLSASRMERCVRKGADGDICRLWNPPIMLHLHAVIVVPSKQQVGRRY